jgi:hypothetical protein
MVLTSSATDSDAVALAHSLQAQHLATIVGEQTGRGVHPGEEVPLGADLALFVQAGRSENPLTSSGWEGVGVKPDIEADAADALKVALQQLGQKPTASDITALSRSQVFMPRDAQSPDTADAVRHIIDENQRGEPEYGLLTPSVAKAERTQLPQLHEMYSKLGTPESINFVEVDRNGADVYDVKFSNGALRISIFVNADGKIASLAATPIGPG